MARNRVRTSFESSLKPSDSTFQRSAIQFQLLREVGLAKTRFICFCNSAHFETQIAHCASASTHHQSTPVHHATPATTTATTTFGSEAVAAGAATAKVGPETATVCE